MYVHVFWGREEGAKLRSLVHKRAALHRRPFGAQGSGALLLPPFPERHGHTLQCLMLLVDEWWILTILVGDPQGLSEAGRHIDAKTISPLVGEEGRR